MVAARRWTWLWIWLAVVASDQATKLAVEFWTPESYLREVIPGFFNLVHRHNRGVAFGMLSQFDWPWLGPLLIVFALAAVGFIAWLLATGRAGGWRSVWGLALLAGGAAGNVIDRLLHGGVIDFLEFHWRQYYYPAFNVADTAIVVGAGLVMLELIFDKGHSKEGEA
ncbi:MAG TPA: signal peptidase II [Candidatus Acidoferrales bacterium]